MKDVATSPRHPSRLQASPPPPKRPSRPLLSLPLELTHRILEMAVDDHPESMELRKSRTYDPRDHGWRWDCATLDKVKGYAREHHKHFSLMLVCKDFYRYLLPKLLASPTLASPWAINSFAEHSETLGPFVRTLVLHPGATMPLDEVLEAWEDHLPKILPNLTSLESFVPGIWTMLISMDSIACALPRNNRITSLDQLDHFAALDISASSGPAQSLQHPTLSLIASCPNLKRMSIGGINLLEKGWGFVQTSRELLGSDETGEWSASDSVAERFLSVLKLGVAFGGDGQEEGGLESLLLWENSVLSVQCLRELLECLPRLRCFHLDCFTYVTPSATSTPFYEPVAKLFSLPGLIPLLTNLVELTFAPFFGDAMRFTGNLDEILSHLPQLRKLELRSDFVTPRFFRNILSPSAAPITYLCFHALPPHSPSYRLSDGTKGQAVYVILVTNRQDIVDLAERAGEVFSSEVQWPSGAMEEGRDAGDGGWYDIIMRLSTIVVQSRAKAEEVWD